MNKLQKLMETKLTENGDISYKTTGNNLSDLMFLTAFFEKNLDQVKIGTSEKEKLFSMFIRDPRYGLGRRDLGRTLMKLSMVKPQDIVLAGRYDDLWHIPTDNNLDYLKQALKDNDLAKKWMPRLTGKDKKIAKALCQYWNITEKEYRNLIKTDKTVEYKLSYAVKENGTPLNELFNKNNEEYADVKKCDKETVIDYLNNVYNDTDTQEEWFNKLKEYACNNGYTADKKAYKAEPEKYTGMVADFCALLRVIICKKNQSPNIYYLIKYLGRKELINRTNKFFN